MTDHEMLARIVFWQRLRGVIDLMRFAVIAAIILGAAVALMRDRAATALGGGICKTTIGRACNDG